MRHLVIKIEFLLIKVLRRENCIEKLGFVIYFRLQIFEWIAGSPWSFCGNWLVSTSEEI